MQSTEFSITEEGALRITLTAQGRIDLERLLTQHPDWDDEEIFIELIDHQLNDGWYLISAKQVRAQTDSLMLTETVTYDAQGNLIGKGQVYWYPRYEVEPYTVGLLRHGHIIFEKGS
jgi:hypothetical protein